MAVVALLLHHRHGAAVDRAREAARWLGERGHEVRLPAEDAALAGLDGAGVAEADLVAGLDLAVSLGGDGTMLRTVDLVDGAGVPVLGVNLGQLGYLTEVEPGQLLVALERFFAGDCRLQERMRLAVCIDAPSGTGATSCTVPALNEAVVGKTPTGQIVAVRVHVDGEAWITYRTDGMILATPTGSTAYNWSAGGPIVAPDHAALLLTPVAPHMLFDRPLVLGPSASVRLEVVGDRTATLSVDGRNLGQLEPGDAIECTAAAVPARLVTFGPRSFLGLLSQKFGLDAAAASAAESGSGAKATARAAESERAPC